MKKLILIFLSALVFPMVNSHPDWRGRGSNKSKEATMVTRGKFWFILLISVIMTLSACGQPTATLQTPELTPTPTVTTPSDPSREGVSRLSVSTECITQSDPLVLAVSEGSNLVDKAGEAIENQNITICLLEPGTSEVWVCGNHLHRGNEYLKMEWGTRRLSVDPASYLLCNWEWFWDTAHAYGIHHFEAVAFLSEFVDGDYRLVQESMSQPFKIVESMEYCSEQYSPPTAEPSPTSSPEPSPTPSPVPPSPTPAPTVPPSPTPAPTIPPVASTPEPTKQPEGEEPQVPDCSFVQNGAFLSYGKPALGNCGFAVGLQTKPLTGDDERDKNAPWEDKGLQVLDNKAFEMGMTTLCRITFPNGVVVVFTAMKNTSGTDHDGNGEPDHKDPPPP